MVVVPVLMGEVVEIPGRQLEVRSLGRVTQRLPQHPVASVTRAAREFLESIGHEPSLELEGRTVQETVQTVLGHGGIDLAAEVREMAAAGGGGPGRLEESEVHVRLCHQLLQVLVERR